MYISVILNIYLFLIFYKIPQHLIKNLLLSVITMDDYQKKYLELIKKAQNDGDIGKTITHIYEDGFADGFSFEEEE